MIVEWWAAQLLSAREEVEGRHFWRSSPYASPTLAGAMSRMKPLFNLPVLRDRVLEVYERARKPTHPT